MSRESNNESNRKSTKTPAAQKVGGARKGAGRKKGSGKFGETTKVIRVPESKVAVIKHWLSEQAERDEHANDNNTDSLDLQALQEAQALAGDKLKVQFPDTGSKVPLPLYSHKVVAGFPSPADDYVEARLDLNDKLIQNRNSTFLLTVQGDSMKKAGIQDGDILIVDRSLEPKDGKVVIAALDGELTVKRLSIKSTGTWLVPENDRYPPIPIKETSDIYIWGVVTATIKQF
ncbi:MAG: LexA family protein [Hydrogenovibrio sp.]